MKICTPDDVKTNLLQILDMVQQGEEVTIQNAVNLENIAVIVSYYTYHKKPRRSLGILKGKATCTIKNDFAITDEELLNL